MWEPAAVYTHLAYLEGLMAAAGVPFERVTQGNLRETALRSARGERHDFIGIPVFAEKMPLRRQCTGLFKVRPIRQAIRQLSKAHAGRPVEQWLGISLDEIERMRDSDVRYITNRYPLVELRMARIDCLLWLEAHGYPRPPKSACIGCPYRTNAQWRDLAADEWSDAVAFDAAIRRLPRVIGETFLHRSRIPLPMVDLSTERERGQMEMWGDECSGQCGV